MEKADYNKTGMIFNIQKFSVNDGPGIRTAVFFKGCPLKCRWCSNPESQKISFEMLWNKDKCVHCNHCVSTCNAVYFKDNDLKFNANKYKGDKRFVLECPKDAISLEGEKKSVREVIDEVMKDEAFYEESNGGITLSGGEILAQADFAKELLLASKEHGLNTCCETTGFSVSAIFNKVIENVDYILFDLKHWDEKKHIEGTGVSNLLPIKNMKHAISIGKTVLPRIPVIPKFNDSLDDAYNLSKTLHYIGAKRCQLLPFHQFGENKYHLLGKTYEYENVPALKADDLKNYLQVFKDNKIDAFF